MPCIDRYRDKYFPIPCSPSSSQALPPQTFHKVSSLYFIVFKQAKASWCVSTSFENFLYQFLALGMNSDLQEEHNTLKELKLNFGD